MIHFLHPGTAAALSMLNKALTLPTHTHTDVPTPHSGATSARDAPTPHSHASTHSMPAQGTPRAQQRSLGSKGPAKRRWSDADSDGGGGTASASAHHTQVSVLCLYCSCGFECVYMSRVKRDALECGGAAPLSWNSPSTPRHPHPHPAVPRPQRGPSGNVLQAWRKLRHGSAGTSNGAPSPPPRTSKHSYSGSATWGGPSIGSSGRPLWWWVACHCALRPPAQVQVQVTVA